MREEPGQPRAAVGFTVKSGWAAVVLLTGPRASPRVVDSGRLDLSDPAIPESRQPYHAGLGTARSAGPELSRLVVSVEHFGRRSVMDAIGRYRAAGHHLQGAGIVVGSLIDPERIANDHIRIHALEGRLFRGIVGDAADRCGLRCSIWRARDLHALAAGTLEEREQRLRNMLTAMGRSVAGSWRSEEKAAALAAWCVLAESRPPGTGGR